MRFRKFLSLVFLSLLSLVGFALAEEKILFHMLPENIPYYREDKIFTAWNPKSDPEIQKPGLKIFFFGKAEGCIPEAKNGPVKVLNASSNMSKDIGVILNKEAKAFIPVPDKRFCSITEDVKEPGSYIVISDNPSKGGIGLFTASGLADKKQFFFQTRDEVGVGSGVNKFEKSTAVTWKMEKETIFPFEKSKAFQVYSKASVVSLPSFVEAQKLPIQVRQQIEIGFANKECLKQKQKDKILCLNKFVFDFLVKRWGGKPLDESRGCLIFVDKAQGGLPHIACYSKPKGVEILEKKSNLAMATSCGEGLQQDIFKDRNFCYSISWEQFMNSLKAIASNHLNKPVTQIAKEDLQSLFGYNFDNPGAWYLTVVSFQQELHNPYKDKINVFVGGNIKEIKISLN